MVKHTQTICQLLPTNCLSVFDHFMGLVLKGLGLCKRPACKTLPKALDISSATARVAPALLKAIATPALSKDLQLIEKA